MRISDWSSDVCSSDLGKPSRSRPPGSLVASVHRSLSFSTSFALVGKRSSPLLSSSRTATSPAAMIGDELIALTEECERVVERGIIDRKSVVSGKSVSVREVLGGRRIIKQKHLTTINLPTTHKQI